MLNEVSEAEGGVLASGSMGLSPETVRLAAAAEQVRVFQGQVEERKWHIFRSRRAPLRAVDREGVIRVQRSDGVVAEATAQNGLAEMRRLWEEVTIYNGDRVIMPDMFGIAGRRVVDPSSVSALEQELAKGHIKR